MNYENVEAVLAAAERTARYASAVPWGTPPAAMSPGETALPAVCGDDLAPDAAITAILPIYDEDGRGVAVCTADGGRHTSGLRVRTILRRLAERNCRTIPLIRRRMKDLLGGRQELPLPISHQLILVPCKVITPRVKGDETIGYFSLRHIRRLVMPAAPRAAPHRAPARGRGRAVGAAQIAPTRRAAGAAGEGSGQPRRTAGGAGEGSSPSARAAAPAYELTDGRRIPLLCTPATASHRLAAAAYAQSRMFGIPLW